VFPNFQITDGNDRDIATSSNIADVTQDHCGKCLKIHFEKIGSFGQSKKYTEKIDFSQTRTH